MFNRQPANFRGNNAVIGCTHGRQSCGNSLHADRANFFTIDLSSEKKPDLVIDIQQNVPEGLENRFQLTLMENVDYVAYNSPIEGRRALQGHSRDGYKGLDFTLQITHQDGLVCIIGCPRQQEFRNSVKNLNYIEINTKDADYSCVIIPKNQTLSIENVKEKIESNVTLKNIIQSQMTSPNQDISHTISSLAFCTIPYETMDNLNDITEGIRKKLSERKNEIANKHPAINQLYIAINELFLYGDHSKSIPLRELTRSLLAKADNYFKQDKPAIQHGILAFQTGMLTTIQQYKHPLIKDKKDVLRLLANIALALTVIGGIFVAGKMIYSKATVGRYLPLFFSNTPYQLLHNVKQKTEACTSALQLQP